MTPAPEVSQPPTDLPSSGSDDLGADARVVMSDTEIARALRRMAHEVLERNKGAEGLVVLGIPTRGVPLARRLAAILADVEGVDVPLGAIDITMYRDDLRSQPIRAAERLDIPAGGIDGKTVVLVDDVLCSGRTVRAALDALTDLGRPQAVRLAVLVDRGHRDLPIRADHVGKNLPTSAAERVCVKLAERDGSDEVVISGGHR
ncbi:bifunctional pyr operon transcriptional regulator/uracil phosphoribosyltransferase PyrR [Arsenicicoccus dermatophilus]|uniref:bifunctional pyr operon transcriptional regulator/uracil phosphoribosyltransferase PyrR n=1 Tax=Arsenicicoccus dermatophilus TaxID=1076331 RepID=UPI003916E573